MNQTTTQNKIDTEEVNYQFKDLNLSLNNNFQQSKQQGKSIENRSKSNCATIKKDLIFLTNNKKLNQFNNLEYKLNDLKTQRL
jgi:hypothetical protein